jgi:hypothetical protein
LDNKYYSEYVNALTYELERDYLIREVCRFPAGMVLLQDKGDDVCHKVIHYVVDGNFSLVDLTFCTNAVFKRHLKTLERKTPADLFFGNWQEGNGYEAAVLKALSYCSSILVGAVGE